MAVGYWETCLDVFFNSSLKGAEITLSKSNKIELNRSSRTNNPNKKPQENTVQLLVLRRGNKLLKNLFDR
jgi:hypothetical protein